jgi:uncharacterized protein
MQKTDGRVIGSRVELVAIYRDSQTITVVGASSDPAKPGNRIPRYLQAQGYRILPINPRGGEMFGERVHNSLSDIDGPVDVVDVFRPPAEAESIARDAIAIGAKVLWFQPGTDSDKGVRVATEAGLLVVSGRCMGATHGALGLGPGPNGNSADPEGLKTNPSSAEAGGAT